MTENDKALVERMRKYDWRGSVRHKTAHEAADRIEQLTAEVQRLIEACAEPAFEVGVLREALDWMADSEPLVVEAILNRVRAALEAKQ